jgi:hypothetical protein
MRRAYPAFAGFYGMKETDRAGIAVLFRHAAQDLEARKQTTSTRVACRPMAGDACQSCEAGMDSSTKEKLMAFDDACRFNQNLLS